MEFKKATIGDFSYGLDEGLAARQEEPDFERDEEGGLLDSVERYSSQDSVQNEYKTVDNFNFFDPQFDEHLRDTQHPNHENIVNFLLHLAICHTIVIQKKKKEK